MDESADSDAGDRAGDTILRQTEIDDAPGNVIQSSRCATRRVGVAPDNGNDVPAACSGRDGFTRDARSRGPLRIAGFFASDHLIRPQGERTWDPLEAANAYRMR